MFLMLFLDSEEDNLKTVLNLFVLCCNVNFVYPCELDVRKIVLNIVLEILGLSVYFR